MTPERSTGGPDALPLLALALAAFAASLPASVRADDSFRCEGGIVTVGDHKIDLLGKCGEPALEEPRVEERLFQQGEERHRWRRRISLTAERWTYNFGPQRFLQFVTLEAGKIVAIARGGYGYPLPRPAGAVPVPRARCDHASLRVGASTFDVATTCGEPALKEVRVEATLGGLEGETEVVQASNAVTVEIWTYDFGPSAFVRFLEFVDGTLTRIDLGTYGYAR
jgi:hypothetical protein